jgi:hypothetical protein
LASPGWRAVRGQEGLAEFESLQGDAVINANALAAGGAWTIGIGVKQAEVQAAAWHAVRLALLLGGLLSALSIVFAVVVARRIRTPLPVWSAPPNAGGPATSPRGPTW